VQHHLGERDEGNGEPNDLPVRRIALLLASAALAISQGCAAPERATGGAVVMASGRDDHGLLARPALALQRSPLDLTVTGSAPDGAFLRVVRQDHSWLYVRTIAQPAEEGWINDFYLRSAAVLQGEDMQVRFVDARWSDGTVLVSVVPVSVPNAATRWVPAKSLREVGAR
jgi:hypothetical protein